MKCPNCDHDNVTGFRFCEVCLTALNDPRSTTQEIVGGFFDDADLIQASPIMSSRGTVLPTQFELPWLTDSADLGLVGRGAEVSDVTGRVLGAFASRQGAMLTVKGDVGSGRSRVAAAVRDRVLHKHKGARFIVASAQSSHRPYSLIERLLRLRFDIPEYLGGTIAGERFERAGEVLFGDSSGAEVARTCGPMLGFHFWAEHDIDFEDRNEQARRATEALHTLWMRDLRDAPTVVLIDDAGECDAKSQEFLATLKPDISGLPVVFLFVTDDRGIGRREWFGTLDSVSLQPLDDGALQSLAAKALTGIDGITERALSVLAQHAEGKPGALLAAIESLVAKGGIRETDGAWSLQPEVLDELVKTGDLRTRRGGRYDPLTDEQLEVAKLAAIFGRNFWLGGVIAMMRQRAEQAVTIEQLGSDAAPSRAAMTLNLLVDLGAVLREHTPILPAEDGFRFVEPSDVEKLRDMFEPQELPALYRRAAEWLELVGEGRSADLAEVLAPLWVACGETTHAAHLYLRAGSQALDQLRHDDARRHLTKARELSPPDAAGIHLKSMLALGKLAELEGLSDDAEELYRSALGVAWSHRARGYGARSLNRLGRLFRAKGQVSRALDHLVPALQLFEQVGDIAGQAGTSDDIGRSYWLSGNVKPALRFLQRAAQLRERIGDKAGLAVTLTNMGILAMTVGNFESSRAHLDRALNIRRDGKNVHGLVETLNALGALHLNCGEVDEAVASMEEAYDLSKRIGNRRMQAMLQNNLGETLLKRGRLQESEALLYKAVEGAGRLEDHNLLSDSARNLALAAFQRDDHQRALTWSRRSVAAAQLSDVARVKAAAMGTLGEILAGGDDIDGADQALARAAQLWVEANDRNSLSNCLQTRAAFLVRVGRGADAKKVLAQVDKLARRAARKGTDSSAS